MYIATTTLTDAPIIGESVELWQHPANRYVNPRVGDRHPAQINSKDRVIKAAHSNLAKVLRYRARYCSMIVIWHNILAPVPALFVVENIECDWVKQCKTNPSHEKQSPIHSNSTMTIAAYLPDFPELMLNGTENPFVSVGWRDVIYEGRERRLRGSSQSVTYVGKVHCHQK